MKENRGGICHRVFSSAVGRFGPIAVIISCNLFLSNASHDTAAAAVVLVVGGG